MLKMGSLVTILRVKYLFVVNYLLPVPSAVEAYG